MTTAKDIAESNTPVLVTSDIRSIETTHERRAGAPYSVRVERRGAGMNITGWGTGSTYAEALENAIEDSQVKLLRIEARRKPS